MWGEEEEEVWVVKRGRGPFSEAVDEALEEVDASRSATYRHAT
jgi:hypothetical protein